MGLKRVRVDSVAKLQKKKTMAELQEENEALKTKVSSLETNLDNTQMALCDVYEQLIAVTSAAEGGVIMAEVYANLIRRGRKTIEQVPEHLREEVKAILAADGNA